MLKRVGVGAPGRARRRGRCCAARVGEVPRAPRASTSANRRGGSSTPSSPGGVGTNRRLPSAERHARWSSSMRSAGSRSTLSSSSWRRRSCSTRRARHEQRVVVLRHVRDARPGQARLEQVRGPAAAEGQLERAPQPRAQRRPAPVPRWRASKRLRPASRSRCRGSRARCAARATSPSRSGSATRGFTSRRWPRSASGSPSWKRPSPSVPRRVAAKSSSSGSPSGTTLPDSRARLRRAAPSMPVSRNRSSPTTHAVGEGRAPRSGAGRSSRAACRTRTSKGASRRDRAAARPTTASSPARCSRKRSRSRSSGFCMSSRVARRRRRSRSGRARRSASRRRPCDSTKRSLAVARRTRGSRRVEVVREQRRVDLPAPAAGQVLVVEPGQRPAVVAERRRRGRPDPPRGRRGSRSRRARRTTSRRTRTRARARA